MPKNKTQKIQIGTKFGRLTTIRFHHQDNRWRRWYLCRCDCGKRKVIHGSAMVSGNTRSCGCLSTEAKRARLLPNNKGVINQIILGYKRHAKGRGFAWKLNFNAVTGIINKPCFYCGTINSNKKITKNCKSGFEYNGIDRINSQKGYSKDNCVPCCVQCNKAKMAMSRDDFLSWIKKVYCYSKTAMAEQWG